MTSFDERMDGFLNDLLLVNSGFVVVSNPENYRDKTKQSIKQLFADEFLAMIGHTIPEGLALSDYTPDLRRGKVKGKNELILELRAKVNQWMEG